MLNLLRTWEKIGFSDSVKMREIFSTFQKLDLLCNQRPELFLKPIRNSRTIANEVRTFIKLEKY